MLLINPQSPGRNNWPGIEIACGTCSAAIHLPGTMFARTDDRQERSIEKHQSCQGILGTCTHCCHGNANPFVCLEQWRRLLPETYGDGGGYDRRPVARCNPRTAVAKARRYLSDPQIQSISRQYVIVDGYGKRGEPNRVVFWNGPNCARADN